MLAQSELSVPWGELHSGNIDRTGIQMRSSYQPSAFDITIACLISTSDVGRPDRTGTEAHWEGRTVPSWEDTSGRKTRAKCVCGVEGCGEAILREREIFCVVFNMAFL